MRPYPIMVNLEGKKALVVGGGRVATRKVAGLLDAGAKVIVVSPVISPELREFESEGKLTCITDEFREDILDRHPDTLLLFGTTDDREINTRIYQAGLKRKIFCNIADVPDLCTFIVPALITQGELMIAVSTGGSSPALARLIREDLEKRFGPEYAEMTRLMGELRKLILQTGSSSDENKKTFTRIVNSDILNALKQSDYDQAVEILRSILPEDINPEIALRQETRS